MIFVIFWVLIISKDSNAEFAEKPRTCCKYSNKTECPDTRSCTLASPIANNIHPSNLEQCIVQLDSKKDQLKSQCSTGKKCFFLINTFCTGPGIALEAGAPGVFGSLLLIKLDYLKENFQECY